MIKTTSKRGTFQGRGIREGYGRDLSHRAMVLAWVPGMLEFQDGDLSAVSDSLRVFAIIISKQPKSKISVRKSNADKVICGLSGL